MPVELSPQPTRGVPAPPAGEEALRSKRMMQRILWVGFSALGACLLCQSYFLSPRNFKKVQMIKAVSNGKQIALCLYDFDSHYGAYPSSATAPLVKASSHSTWALGDATSSELFQQLLVSGCASQED